MSNHRKFIVSSIEKSIEAKQHIINSHIDSIIECSALWIETIQNGGKIFFCGNGGSASDAQHLATELIIRFKSENDRPAIPAIALNTDTSLITACSNDYGFNEVFARQIEGLATDKDLLVGITTSGNSPNIIRAVEAAKQKGTAVMCLLGKDGGKIAKDVKHKIIVPVQETARIQETHIMIGHILCEMLENELYG